MTDRMKALRRWCETHGVLLHDSSPVELVFLDTTWTASRIQHAHAKLAAVRFLSDQHTLQATLVEAQDRAAFEAIHRLFPDSWDRRDTLDGDRAKVSTERRESHRWLDLVAKSAYKM